MVTLADNLKKEKAIQEKIYQSVDNFQSFVFNAGAGAGKTYALIEALKYLLKSKGTQLKKQNQKVVCITYTNVAVNEIKKRLGNTQLIEVSTIHEMLWEQISPYKSLELVAIHKRKLEEELRTFRDEKEKYKDKPKITPCFIKSNHFERLLTDEARQKYYQIKREYSTAKLFTEEYLKEFGEDHHYLEGVLDRGFENFTKFIELCFKIDRYEKTIERIDNPLEEKKIVIEYDAMTNQDRLTSMRFSHDTLLDYSYQMFEQYPLLNTIFMDKYPYLFIDEYQDTHKIVIDFVKNLYEQQKNKAWLVGFFGDHKQSIYDDGVGEELFNENKERGTAWLKVINKPFNRRSPIEIVELINRVRSEDDFQQMPLNPENSGGDVRFFESKSFLSEEQSQGDLKNLTERVVEDYRKQYPEAERVDCFVALNKTITELGGFSEAYDAAKNFIDWNNINTQLLSHDLTKLHPAILLLYKTLNLYHILSASNYSYNDLLGDNNKKGGITLKSAKDLYSKLFSNLPDKNCSTFKKFIANLSSVLSQVSKELQILIIKTHFQNMPFKNQKEIDQDDFKNAFRAYLTELIGKDEYDIDKNILNIDLTIWLNWFEYIKADDNKSINYHTFHSTKGEEYENVIIIMGNDFGSRQGKDKFKKYFLELNNSSNSQKSSDFIETQNLLYVIFSRAIKNLWVVYVDPIDEIEEGIGKIFNQHERR